MNNSNYLMNLIQAQIEEALSRRQNSGGPAQQQVLPQQFPAQQLPAQPLPVLSTTQSQQSPNFVLSRSSSSASVASIIIASPTLSRSSSDVSSVARYTTPTTQDDAAFGSDSDSSAVSSHHSSSKRKRMSKKSLKKLRKQRRRRKKDNLANDKKAVNDDLMALIDQQFLAPFTSAMFYRKLKKPSPEGQQLLKQNEDMDIGLLKSVTRQLRARLCSRDINRLREIDPTLEADTLNNRYGIVMITLAKKTPSKSRTVVTFAQHALSSVDLLCGYPEPRI